VDERQPDAAAGHLLREANALVAKFSVRLDVLVVAEAT